MEKHILSLIKENNRVIIPNFGAFIVAKEKGFTILFNNFLSFNDGLLIDHVVASEQATKEEATKKVEEYVERVKEELDTHGRYQIEGLGTFTKDNTGILRFSQSEDINEDEEDETSEPELLDIDNSAKEVEEPKVVEKPVEETPSSSIIKETPLAEVEEEKKEEVKVVPTKVEPETKKMTKEAIANKYLEEDKKKRNRAILIFALIFIPLFCVVIYFTLFHNKKDKKVVAMVETPVKKPATQNDALKVMPKQEGEIVAGPTTKKEVKEEQPAVVKPAIDKTKPHHLIVGSFKNVENAERFMKSLRDKGYDQCSAIKSNSMTLVSVQSFAKLYKAQSMQEEILDKHRMESWILTKRK